MKTDEQFARIDMKKLIALVLAFCLAAILSACAKKPASSTASISPSSSADSSSIASSSISSDSIADEQDGFSDEGLPIMSAQNEELYKKYLIPIAVTGVFSRDFSPEDMSWLTDNGGVRLLTLADALDNQRMYKFTETEKVPADFVDGLLTKHFTLDADTIHKACADIYDAESKTYSYGSGLGGGPAEPIVTGSEQNGKLTTIFYTWYIPDPSADEFHYMAGNSGELVMDLSGKDFKYISNKVNSSQPDSTADGEKIPAANPQNEEAEKGFYDYTPAPGEDEYYLTLLENKAELLNIVSQRVTEYKNGTPPDNPNHYPPYPDDFPPTSELHDIQSTDDFAIRFAGNPDALGSVYIAVPIGSDGNYEIHICVSQYIEKSGDTPAWGTSDVFFEKTSDIKWHKQDIDLYAK